MNAPVPAGNARYELQLRLERNYVGVEGKRVATKTIYRLMDTFFEWLSEPQQVERMLDGQSRFISRHAGRGDVEDMAMETMRAAIASLGEPT